MTSFGGLDLETKHRYSKVQLRSTFLPIDPSPPHPDNNILLKLDHDVTLRKNSYVKTEEQKRILFSLLRNYDRHGNKVYALTSVSYEVVVEHIGYKEPAVTVTVPVPVSRPRQPVPVAQPLPESFSVPSYGYGTIPSVSNLLAVRSCASWFLTSCLQSHPKPVSRSAQDIDDFWSTYNRSQYNYNQPQRKRTANGHSSGGSPDDLSKDAQVVLGLIFIATFACGVAFIYWLIKNLFGAIGGLKQVDWHKVTISVEGFLWDVLVNMAKVVKYLVVAAAKGVAWVAKGVWGLVRDWIIGTPGGILAGQARPVMYSEVLRRYGWSA